MSNETEPKKVTRKRKESVKAEPIPEPESQPWFYQIPIKGTITLQEPTEEHPGIGLFLLEGGLVRWSTVILTNNEP